jgi:hypothetical protein
MVVQGCFPAHRARDLAMLTGQAKRDLLPVHRHIGPQVNHVHALHLVNPAANL